MHRLRLRDRQQALRPGPAIPAIVAALLALALALPAAASAAEVPLEINITGTGEGIVECKVNGGSAEECELEYPAGTALVLVAVPEPEGFEPTEFVTWGGACSGSSPTCPLTMSAPRSVSATFALKSFKLKVNKTVGTGQGSVECDAGSGAGLCAAKYTYGTEVTLIAKPEEGSEFIEWDFVGSAGCESEEEFEEEYECVLMIEEDVTVNAIFNLQPRLEIVLNGSGSSEGTLECEFEASLEECRERYPSEAVVILYAEAGSEAKFVGWGGDCSGAEEECELTMDEPKSVTATFKSTAERTLTIERTGPGTVTGLPGPISCGSVCAGTYPVGTVVTLTAAPAPGSFFSGWAGGGCKGIGKTCTVTMVNVDTLVAAEFEAIPPPDPEEELLEVEAGTARAAGAAQVKAGKAALKLTCSDGPCKGTLKLTAKFKQGKKTKTLVIGTASFKLAEDATKTLKVKLSAAAKRALGKGRTIKAKLSGTGIAASTVKLKPA